MESNEIKKVITIDGTGAVSSLNNIKTATDESVSSFETLSEAREYIDGLKESLNDLDESSEEYKSTCKEIEDAQNKLKDSIKGASDDAVKLSKSYDQLETQMAELTKQWKVTTDEAKRAKLGEQIKGINDQLKNMDASVGNYQRNIGDYEGAFTDAFNKMSDGLDKVIPGTRGVYDGVIKIVGAVKALKTAAMTNPVTAALSVAATVIAGIVANWEKIKNFISGAKKEAEDIQKIQADADGMYLSYTDKLVGLQRKKEEIIKTEESLQKNITFYEGQIFMIENRQLKNLNARLSYLLRYNSNQLTTIDNVRQEINYYKSLLDSYKVKKEYDEKELENLIRIRKEQEEEEARIKRINEEEEARARAAKITERANAAMNEILSKQEEFIRKRGEEEKQIAQFEEDAALSFMNEQERQLYILEKNFQDKLKLYKQHGKDVTLITAQYMNDIAEIEAKYSGDEPLPANKLMSTDITLGKPVISSQDRLSQIDEEFALQTYIADKTIQIEYEKNQKLLELDKERLMQKKTTLQEILSADNLSAEERKKYAEELARVDADIVSNSEQSKNAELLHAKEIVSIYSDMTSSLGDLMSTIAGIWEDNINARYEAGEITEKQAKEEFENNKKMQISSAILTGLAGMAAAIASPVAAAMGPPGWIAAGVQAAVIAANTAAQIVKIKQTQFSGGSVSGPSVSASPSSSATGYIPNYFTNVTGRSETEDLKNAVKDQKIEARVYVVESDIRAAGDRVEVRDSESTF